MSNIDLKCIECRKDFYLNPKEQEFYRSQNYALPKRCHSCRQWRKHLREKAEGEK